MSENIPTPSEKDVALHVCAPVPFIAEPTEGSVVSQCEECGQDVWREPVSPVPADFPGTVKVICLPCIVQLMERESVFAMNIPGTEPFETKPLGA